MKHGGDVQNTESNLVRKADGCASAVLVAITLCVIAWFTYSTMAPSAEQKGVERSAQLSELEQFKEEHPGETSIQVREWLPACGNIWSGAKLYYYAAGKKHLIGTILGGNENYFDPNTEQRFRGVKIHYANGSDGWKERGSIIYGSKWFVRADDKALTKKAWIEYTR